MLVALRSTMRPCSLLDHGGSLACATCASARRSVSTGRGGRRVRYPSFRVAILSAAMEAEQHLFWWSTGLCMREFFCREYSRALGIFLLRAHRPPAVLWP